ncbi:MAG: hypothetical protein QM764_17710 [Chitinophagaceae bacterium]
MTIAKSVLELIGNDADGESRSGSIPAAVSSYLKLESQNPGGSIKDRIGLSMIEGAERDGRIKPGRDARRRHRR